MTIPIDIIGIGADAPAGLRPELLARIAAADFLAGGERHLGYFPEARGERFVIKDNLPTLIGALGDRVDKQHCVVLASGDPLFYGIGNYLIGILGVGSVRVEPAVSSMQLAFARVGVPWQAAALGSVHGRDLRSVLLPMLGQRLVGLFTQDGDSPAAVARFFLARGLYDYEAVVGENLGATGERLTRWSDLRQLAEHRFAPLNYLILIRNFGPPGWSGRYRALVPGVPDSAFVRPETGPEVMTRQEVRSVLVGRMPPVTLPGDLFWDIGAGLGTVSVELAVLRPHVEVLAVERDPERIAFLRRNRERFDAYNIRVVEGDAPDALRDETERPRLVFIGGSGDNLASILDLATQRLLDGGRLVANFVTLEHLTMTLQKLREWGWPVEITEIHVSRSDALAGLTGLKPQRGVFIVRADKPEAAHA